MTAVCFKKGTRILTADGYAPIETLEPGILVAKQNGDFAAVQWIGRRELKISSGPDAGAQTPIRIKAGALGPDTPCRDLCVSPAHGMVLDGKLVNAIYLLNGETVVRDHCESVEYFHVECEQHVVLMAENAPSESFYPSGENRNFFANHEGAVDLRATPPSSPEGAKLCAPIATREDVAAIREMLWHRAVELRSAVKAA